MWEGVKQSDWNPPQPHERQQVSVGGEDPHRAIYRDYTSKPLTLAEQIDALVSKSKT
jgi:hypothetical protein